MNETRLQMEERHVREGAERIANQKVLIAFLKRGRHEAALTTAEALKTWKSSAGNPRIQIEPLPGVLSAFQSEYHSGSMSASSNALILHLGSSSKAR
jgi:hypothetical protein